LILILTRIWILIQQMILVIMMLVIKRTIKKNN
jgi:hypothetical protein